MSLSPPTWFASVKQVMAEQIRFADKIDVGDGSVGPALKISRFHVAFTFLHQLQLQLDLITTWIKDMENLIATCQGDGRGAAYFAQKYCPQLPEFGYSNYVSENLFCQANKRGLLLYIGLHLNKYNFLTGQQKEILLVGSALFGIVNAAIVYTCLFHRMYKKKISPWKIFRKCCQCCQKSKVSKIPEESNNWLPSAPLYDHHHDHDLSHQPNSYELEEGNPLVSGQLAIGYEKPNTIPADQISQSGPNVFKPKKRSPRKQPQKLEM